MEGRKRADKLHTCITNSKVHTNSRRERDLML